MKLLYFISEDWFFVSHFFVRAKAAVECGYDVVVVTNVSCHLREIEEAGIRLIPLDLYRRGKKPWEESRIILKLYRILKQEKPEIIHNVALKPMIYGSLAAKMAGVQNVVNAIVGLGAVFISNGVKASILRSIVSQVYRMMFRLTNSMVVFENNDDVSLFLQKKIVKEDHVVLIRGAGVDVERFKYYPEPECVPVIVLLARMLWDKGVGELVEAASILKNEGSCARVILVGAPDRENPAAISEDVLQQWNDSGVVEWWGQKGNIPEILSASNIVVLPSYREGLPKALLEAASCGRALVAADVPGCREIVKNYENGFLVPARDPYTLAEALKRLINDKELRIQMGKRSRKIVEECFSDEIVVAQTLKLYSELTVETTDV